MKHFKEFRQELLERSLKKGEKISKKSYVKKLEKHKKDFEKRYGDDAMSVIHGLATNYAKKKISEDVEIQMDRLNYESRPIFSGTERLPTALHKQNWIRENLPNANSEELWISDKANGGIGWQQPDLNNTKQDILSRYQKELEKSK